MSLLAETLVDEWLNRQGFLTLRGLRAGVGEIDLLGIRCTETGVQGWHVEVHASFRPVGYVTDLTPARAKALDKPRGSTSRRSREVLAESVRAWVSKKFSSEAKSAAREKVWPGAAWRFHFVHGIVNYPEELEEIASHDISVVPLRHVLDQLSAWTSDDIRGAAGTDIAEILNYYARQAP